LRTMRWKPFSMISKLFAKLSDPEYRKAFVASQINVGIPFQIRALLKSRGWTQEELARRTGMLQPRISALLTPGRVRHNIETLRRIAEAFDCGLEVRFVPFGDLVFWSESFNPEHFNVPTFDKELEQVEGEETAVAALAGEYAFIGESFRISIPWQPFTTHPSNTLVPGKLSRILTEKFDVCGRVYPTIASSVLLKTGATQDV